MKRLYGKFNVKFVLSWNNIIFDASKLYNMISTNTQKIIFENNFKNTSVAKLMVDMDGTIVKVNKALCKLLEYSESELIGMSSKQITPNDCCSDDNTNLSKLKVNVTDSIEYDTQCITKYKRIISLRANAIIIPESENSLEPKYIYKEIEKITSNEDLEKEIKLKEFYFDKIMSEMPASVYFKDTENRFVIVNDTLLKNFGTTKEKIIGKTDFDFFAKEFAKKTFDEELEIMKTGKVAKKLEKAFWPDGSYSWVSYVKKRLLDNNGNLIGTFGITKDITETINTENAINEAHKTLAIKNKELLVTLDNLKQAQDQIVNSAKLTDLGQLIAGIAHEINTPLGAINASSSNINFSFNQMIESLDYERINMRKKEVPLMKFVIECYQNRNVRVLSSRDKRKIRNSITEKLESYNIANASKLSDMFVYMDLYDDADKIIELGKDVNLELVLAFMRNLVSINKNSDNISIATEKASNIVLALKKYLHNSQDDDLLKIDLIDNLETVLTLNQNTIKQGVEIVKEYDEIPFIYTYPDEISKVWNNLLTNAFQAMNNSGTLTIKVKNEDSNVVLTFTDTGCGIPEDKKDKIFEPFFTTKSSGEGTGLGLDISKRVIEKHNGTISFDSKVGQGTTFTITLPK